MGKFSIGKSIASKLSSGHIPSGTSILSKVQNINVSNYMNTSSGPAAPIMNAFNKATSNVNTQPIMDKVNAAKEASGDFMNNVKNTFMEKVNASGIKDKPEVQQAIESVKGQLSDAGLDLESLGSMSDFMDE